MGYRMRHRDLFTVNVICRTLLRTTSQHICMSLGVLSTGVSPWCLQGLQGLQMEALVATFRLSYTVHSVHLALSGDVSWFPWHCVI
jgi:hypothetical protein